MNNDKPIISSHKWSGKRETEIPPSPMTVSLPEPQIVELTSLDTVRETMKEIMQEALHPGPSLPGQRLHPLITFSHIGVEVQFTDFDGVVYRGVLYPTKIEE
jgi:hypothetical protein